MRTNHILATVAVWAVGCNLQIPSPDVVPSTIDGGRSQDGGAVSTQDASAVATPDGGAGAAQDGDAAIDASTTAPAPGPAASPATADWAARIAGASVVWYHNFDTAAEVDQFRWTTGYGGGQDPLAKGSGGSFVAWRSSGGADGGGFLR